MALLSPTNDLVGLCWLRTVPGIPEQKVGTTLPADEEAWADTGFVHLLVVNGRPDMYVPQRQPIYQLDFWAVTPGSGKPPWGRANALAEAVAEACQPRNQRPRFGRVTTPDAYADAFVQTGHMLTEPRRVTGDEARFAHYMAELQLYWYALPEEG